MAKIAPTNSEIYKKIQLCVCFPTDDTQQLSLIYKPDENAETRTIVTLTTGKENIDEQSWFNPLNELYYILSKVEYLSRFSMDNQNQITGINDNELNKLKIANVTSLTDLNTKISTLIATINENAKPKIDENESQKSTSQHGGNYMPPVQYSTIVQPPSPVSISKNAEITHLKPNSKPKTAKNQRRRRKRGGKSRRAK